MPRLALAICLIVGTLGSGCASRRHVLAPPADASSEEYAALTDRRWVHWSDWWEDHPVITAVTITAVTVVLVAGLTACVVATAGADDDNPHPFWH
jgi:hypothetical protein